MAFTWIFDLLKDFSKSKQKGLLAWVFIFVFLGSVVSVGGSMLYTDKAVSSKSIQSKIDSSDIVELKRMSIETNADVKWILKHLAGKPAVDSGS